MSETAVRKTVREALLDELDRKVQNGSGAYAFTEMRERYDELTGQGLYWNDYMPVQRPTLEVGPYLRNVGGNDLEFYANCSTRVSLDEETGQLLFEGYDRNESDAKATLNIDQLLQALREVNAQA